MKAVGKISGLGRAVAAGCLAAGLAFAQGAGTARTPGSTRANPPATDRSREPVAGQAGSNPQPSAPQPPSVYNPHRASLTARLLDPKDNSERHAAEVEVTVEGVKLVDPDAAGKQPRAGEGHLVYRLDYGPEISTTTTKLTFHEIPGGLHHLLVELAANDETPLGPHQVLTFHVPE